MNYQDLLIFDANEGVLSLRRVMVELAQQGGVGMAEYVGGLMLGISPSSGTSGGGSSGGVGSLGGGFTSVSLPGFGGGKGVSTSTSPSKGGGFHGYMQGRTSTPMSQGHGGSGRNSRIGGEGGGGGREGRDDGLGAGLEIFGRETTVATWDLRRKREQNTSRGVRKPLMREEEENDTPHASILPSGGITATGAASALDTSSSNWLSFAELSTSSKSTRIVPRSIYLSHQFSFFAFGEDYHALIRRYQFDLKATKIDVRREVEVKPYLVSTPSSGAVRDRDMTSESFVEGYASTSPHSPHSRTHRRSSTAFDETLASAISGGMEYTLPPAAPLPMYPNGVPSSSSAKQIFRNPIPIRNAMAGLGDGMSGSLGRIRREMRNVRSASGSGPANASASASARGTPNQEKRGGESGKHRKEESVPLEFDEEDDDDFVVGKVDTDDIAHASAATSVSRAASSGDGHQDQASSIPPLSTEAPSAVMQPIEDEEGWGEEDHAAIIEAERFEDLSVVGLMDEEQQEQDRLRAAAAAQEGDDDGAGKKKKKNKKKRAE
jgi:hypothetical protein